MADITDVGDAIVQVIALIAYPSGISQPSMTGAPIVIYQGWPNDQQLPIDLKAGMVHVSVFPRPNDKVSSVTMGSDWVEISNDGKSGIALAEIRRQTRTYQITVWANNFSIRDPVASALDSALAMVTRLTLPDGTKGILAYVNSAQNDDEQKIGIYRRDLFYSVNYATTLNQSYKTILEADSNVTVAAVGNLEIGRFNVTNH